MGNNLKRSNKSFSPSSDPSNNDKQEKRVTVENYVAYEKPTQSKKEWIPPKKIYTLEKVDRPIINTSYGDYLHVRHTDTRLERYLRSDYMAKPVNTHGDEELTDVDRPLKMIALEAMKEREGLTPGNFVANEEPIQHK